MTKEKAANQSSDPNGTMGIARTTPIDKEKRKLIQSLDQGRLAILRKDDQNPNLSNLNEKQKHHISRRRKNKATVAKLNLHEYKRAEAVEAASHAKEILQSDPVGLLEAEHDMERTTALTQDKLAHHLDEDTRRHRYDLQLLESAPYGMKYDRSGRYALLYGQKRGHLAMMDCHYRSLTREFHVGERVRDTTFLHNFMLFAAAQKNHVYIYDHTGAEVNRLSDHQDPFALEFLPYHWLLASIGRAGWLKYHDTSTGSLVSKHRTQLGPCSVLRQNPSNAVLHAGHSNGVVTLWSPAQSKFLVKMLCHKGNAVQSLAIDPTGTYMVTGGADRQVKIWDLRMYKDTHAYYTMAGVPASMDISQRGILGIGHAGHATFWSKDALRRKLKDPYMHHTMPRCDPVETLRFRPFEDVCGIGHGRGVSSIIIPGSGEPSLDTAEYNTNPMQDTRQRQEAEVRALLDKLHPNMITLDTNLVGGIEESDPHTRLERIQDMEEAANSKPTVVKKQKNKKRGRSKIKTQLARKQKNVIDQSVLRLREAREQEKAANEAGHTIEEMKIETPKDTAPQALKRFF